VRVEVERIADQLHRSWAGPAWHGPALKKVLAGVDAELALRRPIPNAHTIHELVLHITAWAGVARRALASGTYPRLSSARNWPSADGDWKIALESLADGQLALIDEVRKQSDACLDRLIEPKRKYTYYVLLHGVVQHNLYHAGQIALLKKH
jgi:uncharacterized damage-inducible protein DinB